MHMAWMVVGVRKPTASQASCSHLARPRAAKVLGADAAAMVPLWLTPGTWCRVLHASTWHATGSFTPSRRSLRSLRGRVPTWDAREAAPNRLPPPLRRPRGPAFRE